MNNDPRHQLPITLIPVGEVRSDLKKPILLAGKSDIVLRERMNIICEYHATVQKTISELVIFPRWHELLDGIEGF